jgi:hypothetical protein
VDKNTVENTANHVMANKQAKTSERHMAAYLPMHDLLIKNG